MATLDYAAPRERTRFTLPRWVAPLAVVVMAAALQATVGRWLGAYVERITIDVGVAIVMAVSLNVVNGYTGQFSIGHAAFFAIGGYAAAAVTFYGSVLVWDTPQAWPPATFDVNQWATQTALFIAATLFGGLFAAAAGWVVGLPSLRLRGDYLAIVTLGFGEIVRVLLQQTNTQLFSRQEIRDATLKQLAPPPLGGALGFINTPKTTNVFWAALAVGVTLIVAWRLKKSTFGRSMIAIRENEIAAESMGVNVTRLKVWAFVLAAFFAGVAGSLYAHTNGTTIGPKDAGFVESFNVVIMVVLGGLGSISGAALAAVLYVVAQQWLLDPTHIYHIGLIVLAIRVTMWPGGRAAGEAVRVAIIVLAAALFVLAEHFRASVPLPMARILPTWVNPNAVCLIVVLALTTARPPGGWTADRRSAVAWGVGLIVLVEVIRATAAHYEISLGDYRIVLFALILILVMILRPGGLFGTHEVSDLLRMRRRIGEEVPT